jgi:hypothetical protein
LGEAEGGGHSSFNFFLSFFFCENKKKSGQLKKQPATNQTKPTISERECSLLRTHFAHEQQHSSSDESKLKHNTTTPPLSTTATTRTTTRTTGNREQTYIWELPSHS